MLVRVSARFELSEVYSNLRLLGSRTVANTLYHNYSCSAETKRAETKGIHSEHM